MTTNEIQDFVDALEKLQNTYDHYRMIQEQEHAHLNRRGSIAEWNIMVREKLQAQQLAEMIEKRTKVVRQRWQQMGTRRSHPDFAVVREKLSQLQALLTRILTCERMNEVLLYNGGYLQSVVAYRSRKNAGETSELVR